MNGCPPVIACRPDEGTHAFAEAAYRCDCGDLPNLDDHAAIVRAARDVVTHFHTFHTFYPGECLALVDVLADLLPTVDEARS